MHRVALTRGARLPVRPAPSDGKLQIGMMAGSKSERPAGFRLSDFSRSSSGGARVPGRAKASLTTPMGAPPPEVSVGLGH
jgi:hypothetical protein